jgi:hypothetical protein
MQNIQTEGNTPEQNSGTSTRRQLLKRLGIGALGLGSMGALIEKANAATTFVMFPNDSHLLNFALNIEYLEAEYYLRATSGTGLQSNGVNIVGVGPVGNVTIKANPQVPFVTPAIEQYAQEFAQEEIRHVQFLRSLLGGNAASRPAINFRGAFTTMAQMAGIVGTGETFDPFADELSFLIGAYFFEDVGVTMYRGIIAGLVSKVLTTDASGLLGTEAYHAGNIRTQLFQTGVGPQNDTVAISSLRASLDGTNSDDEGVVSGGVANIVPANGNGLVFTRTTAQVLSIFCLAPGATRGGFFPNGINPGA